MPYVEPNHVETIRALKNELERLKVEYDEKANAIRSTIGTLMASNKACLKCAGAGGSEYRVVAEADYEWHDCSACGGTGRK